MNHLRIPIFKITSFQTISSRYSPQNIFPKIWSSVMILWFIFRSLPNSRRRTLPMINAEDHVFILSKLFLSFWEESQYKRISFENSNNDGHFVTGFRSLLGCLYYRLYNTLCNTLYLNGCWITSQTLKHSHWAFLSCLINLCLQCDLFCDFLIF